MASPKKRISYCVNTCLFSSTLNGMYIGKFKII
uniref:Uncharacterized protein n=1 Tax=Anguilla anguilla TaxID=7936 RepID=A0A0E9UKI9_ANGAN